ncbi:transposase family protein [Nonomuraea sp. B1E8]|uniref:transposase family protein n=1 Tax=unclassified Nonomuraea TaxID=2593643 RepID=UPI00325E2727
MDTRTNTTCRKQAWSLRYKGSHHKIRATEGSTLIPYPAMLDVPRELVRYVGRLLHAERRRRGTPTGSRRLTCFYQALFALAWFRSKPNIRLHGLAFDLSQATAYRYLHEVIDVLAAQAPDLHQALDRAAADDIPHLILDGKIFDSDRCRITTTSVKGETIDAWFSGKTGDFGGNIQALCEPGGFPIWTSDVEPGGVVDIEAARCHVLPAVYPRTHTMPVLADPGYQGAGHGVTVPFRRSADGNISASTTAPATASSAHSAASENAASHSSLNAGPRSSTPHSAPAESVISSVPPSSSSISNTGGSAETQ